LISSQTKSTKFENVLNKTIMEQNHNVSHISFVSQNNVGHDKQKLCVHEQNEINYQGNQRSMPSPTLTILYTIMSHQSGTILSGQQ
jgi:hydroxyacyl-ACP dehydratase HTD2-like protein with hotdog domain